VTPRQELPIDIRLMNFTSRSLVWMFVLGALFVGAHRLVQQPWWAIRSVVVQGNLQHVDAAALHGDALPRLQGNWFTINLGAAQQAFAQVPWVQRALVQRVWPLALLVTLQEQQPLAIWLDASGAEAALVNADGQPFEANLGDVQDIALPQFSGPQGSEAQVAQMYARLVPAFAPLHWKIASLALGTEQDWRVQVEGGPQLDLGADDGGTAFEQRLQRFLRLAPMLQTRYGRAIVSADLRYGNGFAVHLQGAAAAAAPAGAKAAAPKTAAPKTAAPKTAAAPLAPAKQSTRGTR
jgi:cell division protein FtsQ